MSYLNTRDLYKRFEELKGIKDRIEDLEEEITSVSDNIFDMEEDLMACDDEVREDISGDLMDIKNNLSDLEIELNDCNDDFDQEEYDELDYMEREISGFMHGVTLIPEDDFAEYCEDFAKDCGSIGDNSDWIVIDWDATADNLSHDYSSIDYQGESYLYSDC